MGRRRRKKKKPRHSSRVDPKRRPKTEAGINPDAFWEMRPSWCFQFIDSEHSRWAITEKTIDANFLNKLIDYERQQWKDILSAFSGKGQGTRNHPIPIDELSRDAQKRLPEIQVFEDELYSLRINSRCRWWGIVRGGVFYFVWNDFDHGICPSLRE